MKKISKEFSEAYDFDPIDPLFGLKPSELSGPKLGRRAFLRLMAAAGMLSLTDLVTASFGSGPPRPQGTKAVSLKPDGQEPWR